MLDVKITIIDREGKAHLIDAPTDMNMNLMEVCKMHELPVQGTCGGLAMCASCHIYSLSHSNHFPEKSYEEEDMLDQAFFVQENSRLGCQIPITKELHGLEIKLAPESM